jgi:hypothetical protein
MVQRLYLQRQLYSVHGKQKRNAQWSKVLPNLT